MTYEDDPQPLGERVEAAVANEMVDEACDQIEAEIKAGIIPERICHECLSVFPIYSWVPHSNVCYSEEVGSVFFECDDCRFPEEEEWETVGANLEAEFVSIHDEDHEGDVDGDYASWFCASCGDPAYDCGCGDPMPSDVGDEIDKKADLMKHGGLK